MFIARPVAPNISQFTGFLCRPDAFWTPKYCSVKYNTGKYEADQTLSVGHQFNQPKKLLFFFFFNLCLPQLLKKKIIILQPVYESYNYENIKQFQILIQN